MDDPQLDENLHVGALRGLERINSVSRCWRAIWNPIQDLAKTSKRPLSVLDVACGGGDLLQKLRILADKKKLPIHFTGLDVSPTAIDYAEKSSSSKNLEIDFRLGNAAELTSGPKYDVVCCSLFMHHLPAAEAVELLRQMKQTAGQMLLVQDLLRTTTGYWLAKIAPKLLTRSQIVHEDGVRSVRAAFSLDEVGELARAADLHNAELRRLWPQRFLLQWQRESAEGSE